MRRCPHCNLLFAFATAHPTLGAVCPICMGRVDPVSTKHKLKGGTHEKLAARDGWTCHLCTEPIDPQGTGPDEPTADHLIPRSRGGTNALTNLRLAHKLCNMKRGNKPLKVIA